MHPNPEFDVQPISQAEHDELFAEALLAVRADKTNNEYVQLVHDDPFYSLDDKVREYDQVRAYMLDKQIAGYEARNEPAGGHQRDVAKRLAVGLGAVWLVKATCRKLFSR